MFLYWCLKNGTVFVSSRCCSVHYNFSWFEFALRFFVFFSIEFVCIRSLVSLINVPHRSKLNWLFTTKVKLDFSGLSLRQLTNYYTNTRERERHTPVKRCDCEKMKLRIIIISVIWQQTLSLNHWNWRITRAQWYTHFELRTKKKKERNIRTYTITHTHTMGIHDEINFTHLNRCRKRKQNNNLKHLQRSVNANETNEKRSESDWCEARKTDIHSFWVGIFGRTKTTTFTDLMLKSLRAKSYFSELARSNFLCRPSLSLSLPI